MEELGYPAHLSAKFATSGRRRISENTKGRFRPPWRRTGSDGDGDAVEAVVRRWSFGKLESVNGARTANDERLTTIRYFVSVRYTSILLASPVFKRPWLWRNLFIGMRSVIRGEDRAGPLLSSAVI